MSEAEPPKKRRLTMDEIMEGISAVAQDPDAGAQRLRALQMLRAEDTSTVNPAPRSDDEIENRLRIARREMEAKTEFDHVIVNDDAECAAADLAALVGSVHEDEEHA